jgi:hypothetical protein
MGVILATVGVGGSKKLRVGRGSGEEALGKGSVAVESIGIAALSAEQAESSNMAAKRA